MEWTISIEGKGRLAMSVAKKFGLRKATNACSTVIIGLSIDDGKKIMTALQSAVVNHEADTYALSRRVCPDCHTFPSSRTTRCAEFERSLALWWFAIHVGCCARTVTQGSAAIMMAGGGQRRVV
ncbi:hypothetical protein NKK48_00860 [Mesorhizobium sp. C386A]|uniref:hypothetical protein n=1 Tax=unclassified Mesorhizobium TaxID=325217 RepID=UPI0003CF5500|nr:hypothetical protein [Mesorhizobium sp. LNJC386A00]ESY29585.1 hypothetical protein X748_27860 [Mesorhizobium sp. LNJC386A00]